MTWFRKKPRPHDCRDSLPHPRDYPVGAMLVCVSCGSLCARENYFDDGWEGDTVEYMAWRPVPANAYPKAPAS